MTRLFESLSQKYHDKFYYTEEANGPKRTYKILYDYEKHNSRYCINMWDGLVASLPTRKNNALIII